MAENLNVTPGTGAIIGMDLVTDPTLATALVGFGKIMDGTLGSVNKLIVNSTGAAKVDTSWFTQSVSGNVSLPGGVSLVGTPTVNASIQGTVPVAGTFWQSTQPVSGSVSVSLLAPATVTLSGAISLAGTPTFLPAAGATITAYQGTNPWLTNASIIGTVPISGNVSLTGGVSLVGIPPVSQSGTWAVNVSLLQNATLTAFQGGAWAANVSVIGAHNVSIAGNVTLGSVNVSIAGGVNLIPTTGGWTAFQTSAMASTVTISAVAGKFGGYMVMNLNSAPAYLQVFDLTSNVTLGLTTPTAILPLPANSTAANGLAANLELANGMNLANGLKMGATQGATNASVVATGIVGTIWYK